MEKIAMAIATTIKATMTAMMRTTAGPRRLMIRFRAVRTSPSKVSETLRSISSSRPVSSPTRTMWSASGGKTPLSPMGADSPAPRLTPSPRRSTAMARRRFDTISFTTVSAPRTGTPLLSSVPSVRQKPERGAVPHEPPRRGRQDDAGAEHGHRAGEGQGPPVLHEHGAQRQEDLGRQRNLLVELVEDLGEARDHEREEKDDRAPSDRDQERGVDEGRHERLSELLRRLQEFGEAAERRLQHTALLSGPHHVDVEAGEGARVMLGQGIAERRPAPDALEEVAHDDPDARGRSELLEDGQRPVEGEPGLEEGGQLVGEGDEVAVADAAGPEAAPEPRALRLGRHLDRIVLLPVEPLDHRPGVRRLHHPR